MSVSVHRSFFVALTSFQLNSRAKHRYLGRDNCVKTRLFWPTASLAAGLTADCAAVTVCSKCVMPTLKIPQIPENLLVILFIDTCLTWHVMKLGKLLFGIKFVCFYKTWNILKSLHFDFKTYSEDHIKGQTRLMKHEKLQLTFIFRYHWRSS